VVEAIFSVLQRSGILFPSNQPRKPARGQGTRISDCADVAGGARLVIRTGPRRLAFLRQFSNHVDEHLSRSTRMWSFPHLDETMLPIQPQISFHLLIRVEPNFT